MASNNAITVTCSLDYLNNSKLKIKNFILEKILNAQNSFGISMLMILVSIDDMNNLKSILKYPFLNMNLQDNCGETALIKAVNNNKIELVKMLLTEYQPSLSPTSLSSNPNKSQILNIETQSLNALEKILEDINIYRNRKEYQFKNYIDTSLKDSSGYTAKKIAYIYDNKEIETLIDNYDKTIICKKN